MQWDQPGAGATHANPNNPPLHELTFARVVRDGLAVAERVCERLNVGQFFRAWAMRWRVQYERPFLVRILTTDTHPSLQYRCTVPLSNFSRFYDVIGIGTDSPAYLPPAQRISIW